jgi:hypothetical protein
MALPAWLRFLSPSAAPCSRPIAEYASFTHTTRSSWQIARDSALRESGRNSLSKDFTTTRTDRSGVVTIGIDEDKGKEMATLQAICYYTGATV